MALVIPSWLSKVQVGCTYKNLREFHEIVMEQEWVVNEPHDYIFQILDFFFVLEREKTSRGHKRAFKIVGIKPFTVHLLEMQEELRQQGYTEDVRFKL